ncbi:MAG: YkgJ family cysteine cluster protein [Ferruginibacter sp.]
MITTLEQIAAAAGTNEPENDRFAGFLRTQDGAAIDTMVSALNEKIEPAIDCTSCGNCCKTLMINVSEEEAAGLSQYLQQPLDTVKEQYLEKGMFNQYVISQMPCHFLEGTRCSIYTQRFSGCREFPALHIPGFTQRLFTVFMHYGRCPIIYNVVEALKIETGFKTLTN